MNRTIWVVSWTYWNGDEPGGGGFMWYFTKAEAVNGFEFERNAWGDTPIRVRLVQMRVPKRLNQRQVTELIDSDIEFVEEKARAEKVYIQGGSQ